MPSSLQEMKTHLKLKIFRIIKLESIESEGKSYKKNKDGSRLIYVDISRIQYSDLKYQGKFYDIEKVLKTCKFKKIF